MENPEPERSAAPEEGSSLNRNRSFKSKQLVRSQAIREAQSPPRAASPDGAGAAAAPGAAPDDGREDRRRPVEIQVSRGQLGRRQAVREAQSPPRAASPDGAGAAAAPGAAPDDGREDRRRPVEIQVSRGQLGRRQAVREAQSPPRAASPDGAGAAAAPGAAPDDGREDRRRPVEIQITGGSWEGPEQRARRRWPPQRDLLSNAPRVACVAGCRHSEQHTRGPRRRQPCPTKQDSGISCPDDCADCSDFEQTGGSSNDVRKACSLDSDDSYCRCPDKRDMKPKINSLSRADSDLDKWEPSGPELVNFIKETLNKNARDRMTLLKIEKELHALVTDPGRCIVRFPVMTSYGRMLVHRVAALFQLAHRLDQTGKNSVTVSKSGTSGGLIPCTSFKHWCTVTFPPSPVRHPDGVHAKSILKRDTHSPDDSGSNCRAVERSKSLEQREKDYERVRRRIFSEQDNCYQDESQWPWLSAGPVKLLTPDTGRNKLLKVQSLESSSGPAQAQSWRSRGAVSKSHSFGGYGAGADPPPPRLLSRQGDLASSSWRLSPSSSGYKTLSLRSTDSVTPSPTGGASPEPSPEGAVVWAVTDLSAVPPGALVIHPQTGRPLTNADGSVYHFDPANPPVIYDASSYMQDPKVQNCEKRRGRLEKQHSFIDAEAECRCGDERNKCCFDCGGTDACAQAAAGEQLASQPEQTSVPVPPSPVKSRYEQNAEQPTNETVPAETSANQRSPYDAPANPIAAVEPAAQIIEVPTNQVQAFEPATNQNFKQAVNLQQYEPPANQRFENRTFVASPHQRPPSFDLANQRPPSFDSANQRPPSFDSANQRPPSFDSANQRPPSFDSANQRPPSFDLVNQRPPSYDSANQRTASENAANQMQVVNMLANQESLEVQYVQHVYSKGYRNDEVTSPPQLLHGQALAEAAGYAAPAKAAPAPGQSPRPVALAGLVYPGHVAQAYPYVGQLRMEQPLQQVYQPLQPSMAEEPKLAPSPNTSDTTFRIDPSYPYPLQYSAACGQCAGMEQPQHRGYNLGYGQLEQPMLQQPYQVGNMLLQHNVQHYPYQEAVQWGAPGPLAPGKLLLHELCPGYPQYPYLYPQMVPQPYPVLQPLYPAPERRPPARRPPRPDPDLAATIQQIKEQMSHLNTQDKERPGNGLLGSAPLAGYNGVMGRPVNDETQLTSAARAIVNSIRNMQASTYQHDYRRQQGEAGGHRERDRRHERDDKRRPPLPRQLTDLSPGNWYRRSPGPVHPVLNHPRRPHPDTRNARR